jgi:hypothetical protein
MVMFNGKVVVEGDAAAMDSPAHAVDVPPKESGEIVVVVVSEVLVGLVVYTDGMEAAGKAAAKELMLK